MTNRHVDVLINRAPCSRRTPLRLRLSFRSRRWRRLACDDYPLRVASAYETSEEEWHDLLSGTHPHLSHKSPLRFIPSNPRCRLCKAPFGRPGNFLLRRYGFTPWPKSPSICGRCFTGMDDQSSMCPVSPDAEDVHGAVVELSMLFSDIRGSSKLALQMSALEFTRLMDRFYKVTRQVLVEHDAIIEKFVGDEVVALFIPLLAGPNHAQRAIEAAEALRRATGVGTPDGPWVPTGTAVHTGAGFVGIVGTPGAREFTALGDPMNLAAHMASQAAAGEILLTPDAAAAAGIPLDGLEHRQLSLKGRPAEAIVLPATANLTTE
jgi:adenylate cyclase